MILPKDTKEPYEKIISYPIRIKKLGLVFPNGDGLKLSLYVDADYATKADGRRPVPGVEVMLGGIAGITSSTIQHCVTLSTNEV